MALARCIYAALAGSECLILDDPIKALDPATAAKCWDQGIKGTMAGKTRVLVVNSQMLQRFASDGQVNRLIIVEKDAADGVGRITYNGKPSDLPQTIQTRLGDGYDLSSETAAKTAAKMAAPTDAASLAAAIKAGEPADAGAAEETAAAVPAAAAAQPAAKEEEEEEEEEEKDPPKGSISGAVIAYCKQMGPWILVSAAGMIATQAAELGLYGWYEHWAADTFRFGFRKNYAIAIAVVIGAQVSHGLLVQLQSLWRIPTAAVG